MDNSNYSSIIWLGKSNKYTIVDNDDCRYLNQWAWGLHESKRPYVTRWDKTASTRMHRLIMGSPIAEFVVDHINGNPLDNRRFNLRICTPAENSRNKRPKVNGSSRFLGVNFCKKTKLWAAAIKAIVLARFPSEELAAKIYDIHAIKEYGEFARPNFNLSPDEQSELWEYYYTVHNKKAITANARILNKRHFLLEKDANLSF